MTQGSDQLGRISFRGEVQDWDGRAFQRYVHWQAEFLLYLRFLVLSKVALYTIFVHAVLDCPCENINREIVRLFHVVQIGVIGLGVAAHINWL